MLAARIRIWRHEPDRPRYCRSEQRLRRSRGTARCFAQHPRRARSLPCLARTAWARALSSKRCSASSRPRGRIKLFGEDVTAPPTHLIARKAIAYTPQEQTLFQDLTVEDNLRLGLRDDRGFAEGSARVLPNTSPRREASEPEGRHPLSGGEQKMLIVSRALLSSPRLMLIDEISEGLQPSMIQRLTEILLAERKRTGTAIFVVEQNVPFAFSMADRYAVLKNWRDRR